MLKPPICRVGGKSKLRKIIIEQIPEHNCYIELFFISLLKVLNTIYNIFISSDKC